MQDVIKGRWCRPRNGSADEKGGIHDDATARSLGFAGGTVAGSIHLEQFPGLLVKHFGEDWWRLGNLSMYFLAATMDAEPVRCYLEPLTERRARVWMNAEGESLVMAGTAGLGEDPESEIARRLAQVRPAGDLRMLAGVSPGATSELLPTRISAAQVDERLAVITEPLACYREAAVFGGRVAPMAPLVHAMRVVEPQIAPVEGSYVGLFGAIEVRYLDGPVLCERDYLARGRVLAVSESPRTEILWYQTDLLDAEDHRPVARMIKMDRLMKDASPLWHPG